MFSNDSRWDRHTPGDDREEVPINAGVYFKKGRAYPKMFIWRDRRYDVEEVTYHWEERRGRDLLHFYTVAAGGNVFVIYFNTKYLYWRLARTCPNE
ncbi:MAG: DUF6504 family protein [Planctomycetota bacterium]|nr:DUF6504 family protein [Planctomycetota bacterium]